MWGSSIAFVTLWLIGWTIGWIAAFAALIAGNLPVGIAIGFGVWLVLWTAGGVLACRVLWLMIFPKKPNESISLSDNKLRYDPGGIFFHVWLNYLQPPLEMDMQSRLKLYFWKQQKPIHVDRTEMGSTVLLNIDDHQRVLLNSRSQQVEIARHLPESDRVWLGEMLRAWAKDGVFS